MPTISMGPNKRLGMIEAGAMRRPQDRSGASWPAASCEDRALQLGDRSQARMVGGACLEVDPGAPGLAEGVDRCADHAGQEFQPVELAKVGLVECLLNDGPQGLVIDRPRRCRRRDGPRAARRS